MKLTTEVLSQWYDKPLAEITEINASKKDISSMDDLSECAALRKLNLSVNALSSSSLAPLKNLTALTLLNLSNNSLSSLEGLSDLPKLTVLNVSRNQWNRIDPAVTTFANLKALILNNNSIRKVDADQIASLKGLNTLVLSHNAIKTLPSLPALTNLAKLSLGHNQIQELPDFSSNTALKELRVNDNAISKIPDTLRHCSSLEILDLGNNNLKTWKELAALGSLLQLTNLNLKGNPIAEKDNYQTTIRNLVPSLRILDGERFDAKFLERREKQMANPKLVEKKQRLKRERLAKEHEKLMQEAEKEDRMQVDPPPRKKRTRFDDETVASRAKKQRHEDNDTTPIKRTKKSAAEKVIKTSVDEKKVVAKAVKKKVDSVEEPKEVKRKKTVSKVSTEPKKRKESVAGQKTEKKRKDGDQFFVSDAAAEQEGEKQSVRAVSDAMRQRSGVVGVVEMTANQKKAAKSNVDVVDVLLNQKEKETGTGLDVGGWDD
ncbi:hypothetical protein BJV82DRAFT_594679 [Fennellomyces sp. T-0311]|nr:hypothetical protein BJV82DRAFT_594679 [Fennellomyces sp. T-0311]